MSESEAAPRIAILGAGPTGLEAALAAAEAGFPFTSTRRRREAAGNVAAPGGTCGCSRRGT